MIFKGTAGLRYLIEARIATGLGVGSENESYDAGLNNHKLMTSCLFDEVIQQVFHGQGPAYLGHGVEGYLS